MPYIMQALAGPLCNTCKYPKCKDALVALAEYHYANKQYTKALEVCKEGLEIAADEYDFVAITERIMKHHKKELNKEKKKAKNQSSPAPADPVMRTMESCRAPPSMPPPFTLPMPRSKALPSVKRQQASRRQPPQRHQGMRALDETQAAPQARKAKGQRNAAKPKSSTSRPLTCAPNLPPLFLISRTLLATWFRLGSCGL